MVIEITFDFRTDVTGKNPDPDASSPTLAAVPPPVVEQTAARYSDFFDLFDGFAGYVDFWLLNDLVDTDGAVKLLLPSENFTLPSVPQSLDDYLAFCECTIEFVTARNERIRALAL